MLEIFTTLIKTFALAFTSVLVFLGVVAPEGTLVYVQEPYAEPPIVIEDSSPHEEVEEEVPPQEEAAKEDTPPLQEIVKKEEVPDSLPQIIPQREVLSGSTVNEAARGAVVNLFCLPARGGFFNPISASGVMIDERGVILTNAHVAQYFLLDTYLETPFIDCVVRTGSPARVAYKAKPLYISGEWINAHAGDIAQNETSSTGEHDFAFLFISESTNASRQLPPFFSSLDIFPINKTINKGDGVLVAGYPAGFLGGITISRDLWVSSSITSIQELFTFSKERYGAIDLVSVGGIIAAQEGSSGGAVVSMYDADLVGIIALRTEGETTGERDLRALTLQYIEGALVGEAGITIEELLRGNLNEKVERYASTTAPLLKEKLIEALER